MAIKTTRLKNVQLPKVETIDLSSQMNGITQTFAIGRLVTNQDTHYLVWNSTVYRNSPARLWYKISEGGTLTTFFDQAPQGGGQHSLLLVISEHQGESPTVTREELDQAMGEVLDSANASVAGEKQAREDADRAIKDSLDEEVAARQEAITAEETARADADAAEKTARETADNNLQEQIDAIVDSTDVKDVVDTKAELDAYDKSTLGDNDIIKVLNDESQNGAITYYRFIKAENNFKFIGTTGPYYTKAESDAKLQEKQDNLVSGTSIKTINGQSILGEGDITVSTGTDDRLSDEAASKANNLPNTVATSGIGMRTNTENKVVVSTPVQSLADGSTENVDFTFPMAGTYNAGMMTATDKQKLSRVPQTVVSATGLRQTSDDQKTSILVKYKNVLTGDAYDDVVEIPAVSAQYNGLMTTDDKSKLDGMEEMTLDEFNTLWSMN